MAGRAVVAAFDFDGTLSRRDTLLPFIRRVLGSARLAMVLAGNGVPLALMLAGRADRDDTKARVLEDALAGFEADRLERAGAAYAAFLVDGGRLRDEVVARALEHKRLGHRVVVVSASPAVYLGPLGRRLGLDEVLATRLERGTDGRLTGRLEGRNCRGEEKVLRLREWMAAAGQDGAEVVAYGDSSGDDELLAFADTAYRVRRGRIEAVSP